MTSNSDSDRRAVVYRIDAETARDEARLADALREPGERLRRGELVAFPTETVYGLGADALDEDAVRRVFAAKGRPSFNPLIVHIATPQQLQRVVANVPDVAERLIVAFWPGALTLVLERQPAVPDVVTGGLDTVGVRMPSHPIARALILAAGTPLAAPSANPFTRVSPTTAEHVLQQLSDRIDAVVDGGPTDVGIESTVVRVADDGKVELLRHGGISRRAIEAIVGPITEPDHEEQGDEVRRSPGRIERHYAPRVPLHAIERDASGALQLPADAAAFGLLCRGDARGGEGAEPLVVLPDDPDGFARGLYAALHAFDASTCERAFVERLPDDPAWRAVEDRLGRAGLC